MERLAPGTWHLELAMREDGLAIDTIILDRVQHLVTSGIDDTSARDVPASHAMQVQTPAFLERSGRLKFEAEDFTSATSGIYFESEVFYWAVIARVF